MHKSRETNEYTLLRFYPKRGTVHNCLKKTVLYPMNINPLQIFGESGCGKTHLVLGFLNDQRLDYTYIDCRLLGKTNWLEATEGILRKGYLVIDHMESIQEDILDSYFIDMLEEYKNHGQLIYITSQKDSFVFQRRNPMPNPEMTAYLYSLLSREELYRMLRTVYPKAEDEVLRAIAAFSRPNNRQAIENYLQAMDYAKLHHIPADCNAVSLLLNGRPFSEYREFYPCESLSSVPIDDTLKDFLYQAELELKARIPIDMDPRNTIWNELVCYNDILYERSDRDILGQKWNPVEDRNWLLDVIQFKLIFYSNFRESACHRAALYILTLFVRQYTCQPHAYREKLESIASSFTGLYLQKYPEYTQEVISILSPVSGYSERIKEYISELRDAEYKKID